MRHTDKKRRGLRHWISALVIACLYSYAWAGSFELNLKIDPALHAGAATSAPVAQETASTRQEADEERLLIARSLPQPPAPSANPATYATGYTVRGFAAWVRLALRLAWLSMAAFLLAYVAREWVRVILVRLRREHKPILLEHANWPVVSILVMPKGDITSQEHRLDLLRSLPFDYPPERIHLVIAYQSTDTGVRDAIHRLGKALPEHVHMLSIKPGEDASVATLLPRALHKSVGMALVVLDQHLPIPRSWLKQAVSPLLDPAVGTVLNRVIPGQAHNALGTRLVALADHADVLLATQEDAIDLMLCGKARIRALRRTAYKHIAQDTSNLTPDGASIVLELVRTGWQAVLLAETQTELQMSQDTIRSPRLHPSISLQALRLASLAFARHVPRGARVQGRAVFFAAAQALVWLASLGCGILLYAVGDILWGSLAIALCAATSFDPLGHPRPAFSVAAAARMAGLREEIRLLPLACASFIDRMVEGCRVSLQHRRLRQRARSADETTLLHKEASS